MAHEEKLTSKIGYLPKNESINKTWREMGIPSILKDIYLAMPKSAAKDASKNGEIRKVKVTLSLFIEDV